MKGLKEQNCVKGVLYASDPTGGFGQLLKITSASQLVPHVIIVFIYSVGNTTKN